MLTFGEASDEWLAPLPASSISAPMSSAMPDPRAHTPGSHPSGAAASAAGRRRGANSGSGDGADSGDDVVGADSQLHSRSLSEPPNGPQPGGAGEGDDGSEGGGSGNATWRSWWPSRLMSGWSGKGQQQAQPPAQGPGPGGAPGQADESTGKGGAGSGGQRHEASGQDELDDDNGSDSADIVLPPPPAGAAIAGGLGAGVMNGMVAELMARLREIYLTDRDLGDMSLGSITQFVYRKLGAGAAADDAALAACPPGPRAMLLDFLAQPSIVFQRPQALAVVLGLLPLADLQMVAAYAVRQHEEAVSGAEAAARDIAAGSDEEDGLALDGGAFGDDSASGSEISDSDEFRLERAAAREAAAAAAEAAMAAAASNHTAAGMPRARRRLRYTSRRAAPPAGSGMGQAGVPLPHQAGAAPGTPPLPPHGGGAYAVGGSHALNLRRTDDDGSAEEVSEEEMASAGDGGLDFPLGGPEAPGDHHGRQQAQQLRGPQAQAQHPQYDSHSAQRAAAQQHARQLQQLRHAGGAGMHGLANARGGRNAAAAADGSGLLCDGERSLGGGSLADEGDDVTEEEVDARCDEGGLSDEDDGVSLGPEEDEEEDEEEDGPCVSLFVVSGDVELGFDRLITQMWGGGAESDDAAGQGQLEAGAAALPLPAPGAGKDRSGRGGQQGQQGQGSRGGRNAQQQSGGAARQLSPTARTANGTAGGSAVGSAGAASALALAAANGDDTVAAEELSGPREDEPYLQVADWWLQHLRLEGPPANPNQAQQLAQLAAPGSADEMRVLRWLYGNIINVQAEEFCARQRELRGGRERDVAILELYDEVAAVWRSLQAVTDKRSRLEALRRAARGHFAVVKRLEEAGGHATLEQATEFLDAVLSGYCQGQQQQQLLQQQAAQQQLPAPPAAAADGPAGDEAAAMPPPPANGAPEQPGTPTTSTEGAQQGDGSALGVAPGGATAAVMAAVTAGGAGGPSGPLLYLCERAVEVVRRHPALAQEPSQRYAAALLERELSVLALVEVMVAAEAEEAARERGVAEESLKRHRAEHREAEAEYQRVQVCAAGRGWFTLLP